MRSPRIWLALALGFALVVCLAASTASVGRHAVEPSAFDPCGPRHYEHFAIDPASRYAAFDARPDALGWSQGGAFA